MAARAISGAASEEGRIDTQIDGGRCITMDRADRLKSDSKRDALRKSCRRVVLEAWPTANGNRLPINRSATK